MAGQAARKPRGEVVAQMNKIDCSKDKKRAGGGDPVYCANKYGNPSLKHSGKTVDDVKKIQIMGPDL